MRLIPLPLSQIVTPSRTPSPSSVTYFMDGPAAVIELSGVGRVQPLQFIFQPPSLFSKITLGGQAKLPTAAFSNSMHLAFCLHPKISNTCEFQDDPIIR